MTIAEANVRLKRAYEPAEPTDGTRVLVERLWPRGVKKETAALDDWMRDIAPSPELRKWYGHDVARWAEFRERYIAELAGHRPGIAALRKIAGERHPHARLRRPRSRAQQRRRPARRAARALSKRRGGRARVPGGPSNAKVYGDFAVVWN